MGCGKWSEPFSDEGDIAAIILDADCFLTLGITADIIDAGGDENGHIFSDIAAFALAGDVDGPDLLAGPAFRLFFVFAGG